MGNPAVASPFEPGSVNKIVTAATAIEMGLTNPDEVLSVPGSIDMGGVTVQDAWNHGVDQYTTTGVFGKSSNVGTLMLAQRVGPRSSPTCSPSSGSVSAPASGCRARARAWSRPSTSGRAARSPTCRSDRVFR